MGYTKRRGGARRPKMSTRARTVKKKLNDIKRAERKVLQQEKKLSSQGSKVEALGAKLDAEKLKYLALQEQANQAVADLQYYRRILTYSELQDTPTQ